MGKYSVPEEIRKQKPEGTMVKAIHGKYYVYEYSCVKINDKWKTKTGKMIGTISPELGYITNKNYQKNDEITCFNFGEYFLTYQLGQTVYKELSKFFNIKEATEIYLLAIMHFVNGFTYVKHMKPNYDISYFTKRFPSISLTEYKVSKLLETLGSHTTKAEEFQQSLINSSSRELAVDGHAIKTCSVDNELAEKGNKYLKYKENQMNALMAYDIKNNRPVFSRLYPGATTDNVAFKDLFQRNEFKDTLFIMDKGFNDPENLKLCSQNGNKYVTPVRGSTTLYKTLIKDPKFNSAFIYKKEESEEGYQSQEQQQQQVQEQQETQEQQKQIEPWKIQTEEREEETEEESEGSETMTNYISRKLNELPTQLLIREKSGSYRVVSIEGYKNMLISIFKDKLSRNKDAYEGSC